MERRNWTIEYFGIKYNMNRESGVSRTPYYNTPDIGTEKLSETEIFQTDVERIEGV